jgi:hypothetical protein
MENEIVKLTNKQISLAKSEICKYDAKLEKSFLKLYEFLASKPVYRVSLRGKNPPKFGSQKYIEKTAAMFAAGRLITPPVNSGKTSDPLLGSLYQELKKCSKSQVENAIKSHGDFMVLENKVGKILEHYLAARLENLGWVWCSGDYVAKIDFVKIVVGKNYEVLQVKNKDVTENSSSSKGRGAVPKWARLKGKSAKTQWHNFPDLKARTRLSEDDFLKYGKAIGKGWISGNSQ